MADKKIRGFVLSEILLASAIISIAIASSVVVLGSFQSMMVHGHNIFVATLIARQELAAAHFVPFDNLINAQKTEIKNGVIFNILLSISYRNNFTDNVLVDVSWQEGSFPKHLMFTDQIVDWRNASGSSCGWLDYSTGNLQKNNSQIINIDSNNIVTDVIVRGDLAYVSADGTTSSLSDLYIIDIHNINNPSIISHISTGPGIASIAMSSHYIFAANAGSYQLQIIDVADPYHPVLVSQSKLPGVVISGGAGFGQSIIYSKNKVFIGLVKSSGPELHIINVQDPLLPIELGSYEIDSTVNDVAVQGNSVFVVTPSQKSVLILDISDPENIQQIGQSTLNGWQTQGANSVYVLGQDLYIGRTLGGFYSPNPEFINTSKALPSNILSSLAIGASVDDMLVFGNYIYLATNDVNKTFQIIKKSNESLEVSMYSKLPSRAVAFSCNNKAMFVVTQNDQNFFHVFSLP